MAARFCRTETSRSMRGAEAGSRLAIKGGRSPAAPLTAVQLDAGKWLEVPWGGEKDESC